MQHLSSFDQERVPSPLEQTVCDQWTIPVLRYGTQEAYDTALAMRDGGLGVVELTMSTPDVFDVTRSLVEKGMVVGVGTVTDPASVAQAAAAGASFVVSFCLPDGFLDAARDHWLLAIPGAFTPQECFRARADGAHWVKIFPVRSVGPAHLDDLAPVLPGLRFMVSGGIGVTAEQLRPWHTGGAGLVAVGPDLGTAGTIGPRAVSARASAMINVCNQLRAPGSAAG